jgi:hypothetical protein
MNRSNKSRIRRIIHDKFAKEQQEDILQSINEDGICKIQKEEFKSVNKN